MPSEVKIGVGCLYDAVAWKIFYPPGMVFGRDRGLWNSLCPLDGDRFLLVTEQNGRITLYPGSVSAK